MPEYTFTCEECGETIVVNHSIEDIHPEVHSDVCGDCDGTLTRQYLPANLSFKGSGFYSTDSALYGTTPGDYESDDYIG